jgi:hypothetical protein
MFGTVATARRGCRRLSYAVKTMSEEFAKRAPQLGQKIDLADDAVVSAWCEELGVTSDQLLAAVRAVGAMPNALRYYFLSPRARKRSVARGEQRVASEGRSSASDAGDG